MTAAAPASTPPAAPVLAFFDLDNTMLRGASVFHIAKAAWRRRLISPVDIVRSCWHQATFLLGGENRTHVTSMRDRALQLIGGHTEQELTTIAEEVYERDLRARLWPATVALAREHLQRGHEVWLVTATPLLVARVVAERMGLTGALGTQLEERGGVFTGTLRGPFLHGAEKAVAARELADARGASLAECWAYSDSANDIPLLSAVGHRTAVNPDSALARHARSEGWEALVLRRSSIRQAKRDVRRRLAEDASAARSAAAASAGRAAAATKKRRNPKDPTP